MTGKKTTSSKSPTKKSAQKKSYHKKTTGEQIDKELQKIPEKIEDIVVNGIVRDLLIIILVPVLYNVIRVSWAEIVTFPPLSEVFLKQIGNFIVLGINAYEIYKDLHENRTIITASIDFLVNLFIGIAFSDPSFIVVGFGYLVILGIRFWFNYQEKRKENL